MSYLKFNIFYILLVIYVGINFYFCIDGFVHGEMELDFQVKSIDRISFVYAFLIQVVFLFFILFSYFAFDRNLQKHDNKLSFSNKWGVGLLCLQVLFLIFNFVYKENIAGSMSGVSGGNSPSILKYFFILAQPDILYLIISINLKSKKLFYFNSFVYVISGLSRSWAGVIVLFFICALCRMNKVNIRYVILIFLIFFVLILIFPFIIEGKFFIRSSQGDIKIADIFDNVLNYGYINYLEYSINYLFLRFQSVGHTAFIIDNASYYSYRYSNGFLYPYWAEGLPQQLLRNLLGLHDQIEFSRQLTIDHFGASYYSSWTMNVGLAGWSIILGWKLIFFIIYICFVLILGAFGLIYKYGNRRLLMLISCFSIIYLFHGWIYAYFTLLLYCLLILVWYRRRL